MSPEVLTKSREGISSASGKGLSLKRFFTKEGTHPFDEIKWEKRRAIIKNSKGETVFEQNGVEVPSFWSQTATDIVSEKYFSGHLGKDGRESSVKQLINRVADTVTGWGKTSGYFATEKDSQIFNEELKYILVNQKGSFNSPVWFNLGIEEKPQCSACFILEVLDNKESIAEWYRTEMFIFSGGSGAGVNLSNIRSSFEPISKKGKASGPISFMKGADAIAGTIKSGGKNRRAAKMVILNVDHPDIRDFIVCKWKEEEKAKSLIALGYDDAIDGEVYGNVFFQNANNSVRVTDEFMAAVENDGIWDLKAVRSGEVKETVKARDIMKLISEAAWHCADPGVQFDTIINKWHTCPASGRINGSNPCFTGDTRILTDKGHIQFKELYSRTHNGETFKVFTDNRTSSNKFPEAGVSLTSPTQVMLSGINEIYRLKFTNGQEVRATKNHRFFTSNRGMVRADELKPDDKITVANSAVIFENADLKIDVRGDEIFAAGWGGRETKKHKYFKIPAVWTSSFAEYLGYLVGDGSIREARADGRLSSASVVFGSEDEAAELTQKFEEVFSTMGIDVVQKIRMGNGTLQLRVNRTPFVRFLKQLGASDKKAPFKKVPKTIFQSPQFAMAGFLRGLFSADGCVYAGEKSRYVGLGSSSAELLKGVQELLLGFGIFSRIYVTRRENPKSFYYVKKNGEKVEYGSEPMYDLRISGRSVLAFKERIGFLLFEKQEKLSKIIENHEFYNTDESVSLVEMIRDGVEWTYNLTEPLNHSYIANGLVVANCSEYMHLDNSACNLASINLMRYVDSSGNFDFESFRKTVRIFTIAQDVIVSHSSYPTEKIAENARAFRQLGLGYANLGAFLMYKGLPYDSDAGRAWSVRRFFEKSRADVECFKDAWRRSKKNKKRISSRRRMECR